MIEDHPKGTTNAEMLERLAQLEQEISAIKARIDDLFEGFKYQVESTNDHIVIIRDLLDPLVAKVFPNFVATKEQIEAIVPPFAADPRADKRREE